MEEKFTKLENIEIPRWYQANKNSVLELHIFADAFMTAYSPVVYFCFRDKDKYKCSFIMSKLRLASIKEKQLAVPTL